jgi:hypothetical protein
MDTPSVVARLRDRQGDLPEWKAATLRSAREAEQQPHDTGCMAYSLVCVECSTVSDDAAVGWRGFLTDDEYEPAVVAMFCPECADREFGQRQLRMHIDDQ